MHGTMNYIDFNICLTIYDILLFQCTIYLLPMNSRMGSSCWRLPPDPLHLERLENIPMMLRFLFPSFRHVQTAAEAVFIQDLEHLSPHDGSVCMPYMVTFTINIPQMLVYIYIYHTWILWGILVQLVWSRRNDCHQQGQ